MPKKAKSVFCNTAQQNSKIGPVTSSLLWHIAEQLELIAVIKVWANGNALLSLRKRNQEDHGIFDIDLYHIFIAHFIMNL